MRDKATVLCACNDLLDTIDRYIEKAKGDLSDKLKKAGFLKTKFSVKRLSEFEDLLNDALEKEADGIINDVGKAKGLDDIDVDQLLSKNSLREEIAELIEDHYDDVLPELTDAYIKQADKDLSFISSMKRTTAWVKLWSEQVAEFMEESSSKKIAALLEEHLKSGKGIDEFVRALQDKGIRNERYRARTVAVTETLRAHSIAHNDAMMQNPCVIEKIWRHTGNQNNTPRPNHVAMNGQKVKKTEMFMLTGADGLAYMAQYPRDPSLPVGETANCHCIVQDGIDPDIIGLPLEERQRMQEEALAELDDDWEAEMRAKYQAEHKENTD